VVYIARDWKELRVEIPLSWRTRNYVGTIYGGSMYGGIDPMYMLMLIKLLGPDYIVWDKAANIRFLKPGRTTLKARFLLDDAEVESIKADLRERKSVDRVYEVELVDEGGTVYAIVEKTIYIRKKREQTRPPTEGTAGRPR